MVLIDYVRHRPPVAPAGASRPRRETPSAGHQVGQLPALAEQVVAPLGDQAGRVTVVGMEAPLVVLEELANRPGPGERRLPEPHEALDHLGRPGAGLGVSGEGYQSPDGRLQ